MSAARPPCSVEGCDQPSKARGWCGLHYARWNRSGDPLYLHPRLKGDPNAPVESSRFLGGKLVFFTVDNRPFIEWKRRRGSVVATERRYGTVFVCQNCHQEAFTPSGGAQRLMFCSHKCAGPSSRDAKLGKTKKGSKKESKVSSLDRLFSVLVRADGTCVHCGATDSLQCAHGFSRRYRNVRWDRRNAFCLCQRCHMFFTHRPLEWDEWLVDRWGAELYGEIRARALSGERVDLDQARDEVVAAIRERGITASQLPKTASGWRQYLDPGPEVAA